MQKETFFQKRQARGPQTLGASLSRILKTLSDPKDQLEITLLLEWENIVGKHLNTQTQPIKLVFSKKQSPQAALYLRPLNQSFAPFIQHQIPTIMEKINTYFGYDFIDRIHLQQTGGKR